MEGKVGQIHNVLFHRKPATEQQQQQQAVQRREKLQQQQQQQQLRDSPQSVAGNATADQSLLYAPSALDNGLCQRTERRCSRKRLDGHKFCPKHLNYGLDGYRHCSYISARSGLHCSNVVHQSATGREGLCTSHARMICQMRRVAASRCRHRDTVDSIIHSLTNYRHFSTEQNLIPSPFIANSQPVYANATNNDPNRKPPIVAAMAKVRNPIDYLSESSEEDEASVALDECSRADDEQGLDSIADDPSDPLRNAGVYTAQEIVTLTRDKLIKMQALYCEYLDLIKEKYRSKRALFRKRVEEEAKNAKLTYSNYANYKRLKQLKAMRKYHRKSPVQLLLKRRRETGKVAGIAYYGDGRKCTSTTTVEKSSSSTEIDDQPVIVICQENALPDASFCLKHILSDDKQLLFKRCQDANCSTILRTFDGHFCCIHKPVPEKLENLVALPEMSVPGLVDQRKTTTRLIGLSANVLAKNEAASPAAVLDNFSRIVDQVVSSGLSQACQPKV